MKKTIALVASAAAVAFAAPVAAQSGPTVDHLLTGEVADICGAYDFQNSPVLIDFGTLSDVDVGSQTPEIANGVTIVCNGANGGTVNITSANGGALFLDGTGGANREVGYTVRATGGSGLAFNATALTSDVNLPFGASGAFLNGQSMTLRFAANGVAQDSPAGNEAPSTTVFAGTYTDTVTVSVTAN